MSEQYFYFTKALFIFVYLGLIGLFIFNVSASLDTDMLKKSRDFFKGNALFCALIFIIVLLIRYHFELLFRMQFGGG